jgi:orotate phosphoribosyltransferase
MISKNILGSKIAEYLLQIQAIVLRPENPFTWASGWKSPIYCDNRLSLSYPEIRKEITLGLCSLIKTHYPQTKCIAGVATAGIPQAAWVADHLGLPLIYVRSEPKAHGMGNQIEGRLERERPIVVIEDLISTGGSSMKAVEAIRTAGGQVEGLLSVFSYGFPQAEKLFADGNVNFSTLCDAGILIPKALEKQYICEADSVLIQKFLSDPKNWLSN